MLLLFNTNPFLQIHLGSLGHPLSGSISAQGTGYPTSSQVKGLQAPSGQSENSSFKPKSVVQM